MRAHLSYLIYVLKHKWYVFLGCLKMKVPLYRAIIHDWSKFTPSEWFPYVHHFHNPDGSKRQVRNKDGSWNPSAQTEYGFQVAWLKHVHRNPHHWQYWCLLGDYGELIPLEIPETYIREMIADWVGAGWAQVGERNPSEWFRINKKKMVLHYKSEEMLYDLMYHNFGYFEMQTVHHSIEL